MNQYLQAFNCLLDGQTPFVSVTLVDTIGSAPQEPGAKMLVTADGLYHGTVGGGKVEKKAIEYAQAMLGTPEKTTQYLEWNLTTDVGMTCGGSVRFYFELQNMQRWPIVIFGAGHVAQALVPLLLNLDCTVTVIDPRADWLEKLPTHAKLKKTLQETMPNEVSNLPADAFVILMTMGHATDKPIFLEILKSKTFSYLGVIGSKAKAVQLKKDIDEAGLPETCKTQFFCPIGLDIGGNHPHEIALSVAAQLLQIRDQLRRAETVLSAAINSTTPNTRHSIKLSNF